MSAIEWFNGKVCIPDVAKFTDDRGDLWAIDFSALRFSPVRSFIVSTPSGTVRGEHGHVEGKQLLLRVSGEILVDMAHDGDEHSVTLTAKQPALLVSAPVWARQTYLGTAPSLVVYCDTPYNPGGYLRSPDMSETDSFVESDRK